jgi:DNA-binding PadR family transcriptional regulator
MHKEQYFATNRTRRGDMAPLILTVLKNKGPMHGYEIMVVLANRTAGLWRPSAGSIYPNLQLLEEQDMVVSSQVKGKRVYSLTTQGEKAASEAEERFKDRTAPCQPYINGYQDIRHQLMSIRQQLRMLAEDKDKLKLQKAEKILRSANAKLTELINQKAK